jgi:hypothetical protein
MIPENNLTTQTLGGERNTDFELRALALSEAIRSSLTITSDEDVVARAETYLKFLKGEKAE